MLALISELCATQVVLKVNKMRDFMKEKSWDTTANAANWGYALPLYFEPTGGFS